MRPGAQGRCHRTEWIAGEIDLGDEVRHPGSGTAGTEFPVVCGGAALTRKFVEDDLRREYSSAVFYAEDAFAGLHAMEKLSGAEREETIQAGSVVREFARVKAVADASLPEAPRDPIPPAEIPQPPFWGVRTERAADFELKTLFEYINPTALFKNQWQLKTASQQDYARLVEEKYKPILAALEQDAIEWRLVRSAGGLRVLPMPVEGQRPDRVCTSAGIALENFREASPSFDANAVEAGGGAGRRPAGAVALHLPAPADGGAEVEHFRLFSCRNPAGAST